MSETEISVVLATRNKGKTRELREIFGASGIRLYGLDDFGEFPDVDETGSTFRENAELKARDAAIRTGRLSLADDSGLEVEALGNAPGVYSARYAGADAGYDVKIARLLAELAATNDVARRARFVCAMAVAEADGRIVHVVEGVCPGSITDAPRGGNGFGYDPVFVPDGFDQTFGELPDEVKQRISHRARAAELIIRYLLRFMMVST